MRENPKNIKTQKEKKTKIICFISDRLFGSEIIRAATATPSVWPCIVGYAFLLCPLVYSYLPSCVFFFFQLSHSGSIFFPFVLGISRHARYVLYVYLTT